MKIENYKTKFHELKNLMEYFKYKAVNFATIDMGEANLKNFRNSSLARLLDKFKIPYFPVNIPEATKKYFLKVILKKTKEIEALSDEYNNLKNKKNTRGRYLSFWIDLCSKELEENRNFFLLSIKPQYIAESILKLIGSSNDENVILIHFGMENTFTEVMKILNIFHTNIDTFYLHYLC